jgi:hypothetical protein
MHEITCICWANLTPFSLQISSLALGAGAAGALRADTMAAADGSGGVVVWQLTSSPAQAAVDGAVGGVACAAVLWPAASLGVDSARGRRVSSPSPVTAVAVAPADGGPPRLACGCADGLVIVFVAAAATADGGRGWTLERELLAPAADGDGSPGRHCHFCRK